MQRLLPLQDGGFSKSSHFWIICFFFERFVTQNTSNKLAESILTCFRQFKFLAQIEFFTKAIAHGPRKGYSLCKMADFQNRLISGIFVVFSSGFMHRVFLIRLQNRF